ncbi:MAG: hypothetical protein EXS41_04040 [Opitutaceae bacterium]|nr:hypothetical protein [Opitutaceae bacterium]
MRAGGCGVNYADGGGRSRECRRGDRGVAPPERRGDRGATARGGDFLVEDNCAVERKALRDFAASVIAGRLFKQTAALAAGARRGVVVIEGTTSNGRTAGRVAGSVAGGADYRGGVLWAGRVAGGRRRGCSLTLEGRSNGTPTARCGGPATARKESALASFSFCKDCRASGPSARGGCWNTLDPWKAWRWHWPQNWP